jgi:hypothetical protein
MPIRDDRRDAEPDPAVLAMPLWDRVGLRRRRSHRSGSAVQQSRPETLLPVSCRRVIHEDRRAPA